MLAALFGWLPWLAVLSWLGFAGPLSPPGLELPALILCLLAALTLTLVFLCLRLLPWTSGLQDPGLWMPQAVCGVFLMLAVVSLLPRESQFPALLGILPWLAFHGARLGSVRVLFLTVLVFAAILVMPLAGLAWMNPAPFDVAVNQGLAFLLAGAALLIPLMALERNQGTAAAPAEAVEGQRPQILGRDELLLAIKREIARRLRSDVPFSVCLLSLDGLSRIHLEHGEAVSKRLNRVLGKTILTRARQLDVVGRRKSTDESIGDFTSLDYVAVLPETELGGAVSFANRIRHAMEQLPVRLGGRSLRCTASAGVAQYRKGESPGSVLLRAQHALERAQRLGSNRVEKETSGG